MSLEDFKNAAKDRLNSVKENMFGASPEASPTKVPKTTKEDKKAANTAAPNQVAVINTARLNAGVYAPETVVKSNVIPADYYRKGRIRPPKEGNPTAVEYDYNPRFLTDTDEEPASIRLIGKASTGSRTKAVDLIPPFSKFFLEGYQEGHMERHQIVETFGEFYAFFFGERPAIYTFSGTLLNTKDINWKEDFMFYYENFLRGTKCVEYQAKLLFTYNLSQVEGFLLGVNTSANSVSDRGVQVSFQFLVTDRKSMRLSVDFGITESNGRFNEDRSIINLIKKGASDPAVSDSYEHADQTLKGKVPPGYTSMLTEQNVDKARNAIKGIKLSTNGGKVIV